MDRKSASSSGVVEIDAVIGDPHPMRNTNGFLENTLEASSPDFSFTDHDMMVIMSKFHGS